VAAQVFAIDPHSVTSLQAPIIVVRVRYRRTMPPVPPEPHRPEEFKEGCLPSPSRIMAGLRIP
jgi:hypothetical protein